MYHYETLGDERFQEFCQALIAASFPNTQCLPTGQPDGGRDAFLLSHLLRTRRLKGVPGPNDLIVFQVKYVKGTSDSRSERDMIEEVIRKEKKKVARFAKAGQLFR